MTSPTIGDTGLTVGEIRNWLKNLVLWYPLDEPGRMWHDKVASGLCDALEAKEREAAEVP